MGNEATFIKSGSVWKKLVTDARRRGCFYDADEDKHLAQAITTALFELKQFDSLMSMDSPLFKEAKWRVCWFIIFLFALVIFVEDLRTVTLSSVLIALTFFSRRRNRHLLSS